MIINLLVVVNQRAIAATIIFVFIWAASYGPPPMGFDISVGGLQILLIRQGCARRNINGTLWINWLPRSD